MAIEKLFEGDMRLGILAEKLTDLIYERGAGIPIPSIIGTLEIVKQSIIKNELQ